MFQNLDMFKTAMSMARHAGLKQAVTAQNIANADTPKFRARAVADFSTLLPERDSAFALRATRSDHLAGSKEVSSVPTRTRAGAEPNGNGVILENEILNSVDAKRQHDRALAVYRASLGMLRSALSKQ
ncbi:FlgB family protein [Marivita sp. GX14005]|uniref:FlgB family protein n=1 Tax=Marivita sp. GX14005 TaxID=2942276 RepID=UPI002019083D|nr:FlgB family protein [Marivita sp. GX14005]MCL3881703.1 FlgB family protein [Marivita sp. GX14005]